MAKVKPYNRSIGSQLAHDFQELHKDLARWTHSELRKIATDVMAIHVQIFRDDSEDHHARRVHVRVKSPTA